MKSDWTAEKIRKINKIPEFYKKGSSIKEIMKFCGVCRVTVRDRLERAGIKSKKYKKRNPYIHLDSQY